MDFHSNLFRSALIMCLSASGLCLIAPANAQTPPAATPAAAADPAQEAAKRAFEALPEAERIALQDGLIWTGDYKGVADGKFGKGTRDAIAAFAARNKLPADGTLDAKGRTMLSATAQQAKDGVHFLVQTDEKTGLRIGLPLKLLTKAKPAGSGMRYSSADDSISVETQTRLAIPTSLQEAFNATIAETPGRKVTYKVLRPDFFVVTGDTNGSLSYTRMTRGERAGVPTLSGFTISYPVSVKARLDPIAIAIANSFVPFPDTAAASPAPSASQSAGTSANPAAAAVSPAESTRTGPKAVLTASGVTVAFGLILTSLPRGCTDPLAGTKKTKIAKQSDADGLTLLSLADAPAHSLALRAGEPASPSQIVVLSFAPRIGAGEDLIGASGDFHKQEDTGSWRLLAPVQNPVAGAVLLDRSGALIGILPADAASGKAIAGVLPQMNRTALPAPKLTAFLADARPKSAEHGDLHTVGEIVNLGRAAMVPIYCMR